MFKVFNFKVETTNINPYELEVTRLTHEKEDLKLELAHQSRVSFIFCVLAFLFGFIAAINFLANIG